jgi:hypothetical protein
MGSRAASGGGRGAIPAATSEEFDEARANQALPLLSRLLGLKMEAKP